MEKLDLKSIPKNIKPNPIFNGLPESLKDPKMYKVVRDKTAKMLYSDHQHKSIKQYAKCLRCRTKFQKRNDYLYKELGFKDLQQYMEWVRVMSIIDQKRNFQVR